MEEVNLALVFSLDFFLVGFCSYVSQGDHLGEVVVGGVAGVGVGCVGGLGDGELLPNLFKIPRRQILIHLTRLLQTPTLHQLLQITIPHFLYPPPQHTRLILLTNPLMRLFQPRHCALRRLQIMRLHILLHLALLLWGERFVVGWVGEVVLGEFGICVEGVVGGGESVQVEGVFVGLGVGD